MYIDRVPPPYLVVKAIDLLRWFPKLYHYKGAAVTLVEYF